VGCDQDNNVNTLACKLEVTGGALNNFTFITFESSTCEGNRHIEWNEYDPDWLDSCDEGFVSSIRENYPSPSDIQGIARYQYTGTSCMQNKVIMYDVVSFNAGSCINSLWIGLDFNITMKLDSCSRYYNYSSDPNCDGDGEQYSLSTPICKITNNVDFDPSHTEEVDDDYGDLHIKYGSEKHPICNLGTTDTAVEESDDNNQDSNDSNTDPSLVCANREDYIHDGTISFCECDGDRIETEDACEATCMGDVCCEWEGDEYNEDEDEGDSLRRLDGNEGDAYCNCHNILVHTMGMPLYMRDTNNDTTCPSECEWLMYSCGEISRGFLRDHNESFIANCESERGSSYGLIASQCCESGKGYCDHDVCQDPLDYRPLNTIDIFWDGDNMTMPCYEFNWGAHSLRGAGVAGMDINFDASCSTEIRTALGTTTVKNYTDFMGASCCAGPARCAPRCKVGQWMSRNGCRDCPAGWYGIKAGRTEEESCAPCPRGYYTREPGESECIIAPAGWYVDKMNSSMPTRCPMGTTNMREGATSRAECLSCPEGTFGFDTSRSCERCPKGTITATSGSSSCVKCDPGTYPNPAATACLACPLGTYNSGTWESCLPCQPGTFANVTGSASCRSCAPGTEQPAAGAAICNYCSSDE